MKIWVGKRNFLTISTKKLFFIENYSTNNVNNSTDIVCDRMNRISADYDDTTPVPVKIEQNLEKSPKYERRNSEQYLKLPKNSPEPTANPSLTTVSVYRYL